MSRMTKAETEALEIVDDVADLLKRLRMAKKPVLVALRRKLEAIYAQEMLGIENPEVPNNKQGYWCLSDMDLIDPIRQMISDDAGVGGKEEIRAASAADGVGVGSGA